MQQEVHDLILAGGRKYGYQVVDSTRLTHYTPGHSGGDGIHYNSEEGRAWAGRGVARDRAVAGEIGTGREAENVSQPTRNLFTL